MMGKGLDDGKWKMENAFCSRDDTRRNAFVFRNRNEL